jgi:hypothetical protein
MIVAKGFRGVGESLQIRLFEWATGLTMMSGGVILLLPFETFQNPAYEPMSRIMREDGWGSLMLLLGALRIVVLFVNGAWRRCSHARATLALFHMAIWFTLFLCFLHIGTVGLGLAFAIGLCFGELLTIIRSVAVAATTDARAAIKHARDS